MSEYTTLTLDFALRWFQLDANTVNEEQVKSVFRQLARDYHPDTKGNFKEKLAASENFIKVTEAKGILLSALRVGRLPQAKAPIDDGDRSGVGFEDNSADYMGYEQEQTASGFPFNKTPRDQFDFRNKRPMERLMDVPLLGPIMAFIMILAFIGGAMGFVLILFPYSILRLLLMFLLTEKGLSEFESKAMGYASGPAMFVFYYIVVYLGADIFTQQDAGLFPYVLGVGWLCLTLLALDEFYSMVRFWLVSRKIKREIALVDG